MLYYIRNIFCIISVIVIASSCQLGKRSDIMGEYYTHYKEDHVEFTDMDCSVELSMVEKFGWSSVDNTTDLALTFHFVEPFEFPSMTLKYEIKAKGEWNINGDTLEVRLASDIDDIEYTFKGSNATRPTEESMVRHIRKSLSNDLIKAKKDASKSAFILRYCNTKAIIKSNNEKEMIISPIEKPEQDIVKKKGK